MNKLDMLLAFMGIAGSMSPDGGYLNSFVCESLLNSENIDKEKENEDNQTDIYEKKERKQ